MNERRSPSAKIQRTLKRVVDVKDWTTITSDELLAADKDREHELRRAAASAKTQNKVRLVCEKCGHPVYTRRDPVHRRPYWQHHKGAPKTCPWWRGDPDTPDRVNARKFGGNQESPLHCRLKERVATLLKHDPRTKPGSIEIDRYIVTEDGRRRPDVWAIYDSRKIAFEIQLATTLLPIIAAREHFYEQHGYGLVWLTWNFNPKEDRPLLTSFEDIFYSHSKNIFSLDNDIILRGFKEKQLLLRVYWQSENGWQSKTVSLDDLTWPGSGLPYAVEPPPPWHIRFRARWLAVTSEAGISGEALRGLLDELANRLALKTQERERLEDEDIAELINCILSLVEGRPVGTRQSNLTEYINTFLFSPRRHRYARLLKAVIVGTEGSALLNRPSVKVKFEDALKASQDGRDSLAGVIALRLFPELFERLQNPLEGQR